MTQQPGVPGFRADGYLPEGLWIASETGVISAFRHPTPPPETSGSEGSALGQRIRAGRHAGRLLIDGSFVTAKPDPGDVDAVVLLPLGFEQLVERGLETAWELETILLTRYPEEIFAAEDDADWDAWVEFFSRTRELDGRRKGLVEVRL